MGAFPPMELRGSATQDPVVEAAVVSTCSSPAGPAVVSFPPVAGLATCPMAVEAAAAGYRLRSRRTALPVQLQQPEVQGSQKAAPVRSTSSAWPIISEH